MTTDQEIRRRFSFSTSTVDDICTTACIPKKRRSPSSPSSQNPFSKKLNLHGFTNLPLQITSPPNSPDISVQTPSPASESAASPLTSDLSSGIAPKIANSTRLNRMKEIITEMSQWCDDFVQDDENFKEGEESVNIDRTEDGFIIKLNCSCGKDYQILLSDSKIYYKL